MNPIVHVIAVAHSRLDELKVFVQSMLNQTSDRWLLTVIHDGHNEQFDCLMKSYCEVAPDKLEFSSTEIRFNDFGHSLREIGLKQIKGDYVLLSNADNYFVPRAIEFLVGAIEKTRAEVIIFDMVHSHSRPGLRPLPPYSLFKTAYQRGSIDISSAVVRKDLAYRAGFRDHSHDGDATYFEDIARLSSGKKLSVAKIPQILVVHN